MFPCVIEKVVDIIIVREDLRMKVCNNKLTGNAINIFFRKILETHFITHSF